MGGPASSTTAETYMEAHERAAISDPLHPPKVWEQFVNDSYSILKRTPLESFLHLILIKIISLPSRRRELAFLDTLLKRSNGKISVLVYTRPTQADQYLHCSCHYLTGCQ